MVEIAQPQQVNSKKQNKKQVKKEKKVEVPKAQQQVQIQKRRMSREVRSDSLPQFRNERQLFEMSKRCLSSKRDDEDKAPLLLGQLYKYEVKTNMGYYRIQTDSISDFNQKMDKIAVENSWNGFVHLNVKLNFWIQAYEQMKNKTQGKQAKEELLKLITQYSLHMLNNQGGELCE